MEYLIPQEWFVDKHTLLLLFVLAVGAALLIKGADWLVEGASGLAYRLGIPKIIVGATIVSLGTTSPEAAVSVMAAWKGEPGLALGNAVGSIIADSGLIFGIGCFLTILPADRFVLTRQGWVQFGSAMLLAVICYGLYAANGNQAILGRWVGVLFLLLLVWYMFTSVKWSKQHRAGEPFQIDEEEDVEAKTRKSLLKLITFGVIGLVLVIVGSHVLIGSVIVLAERWRVPNVVIASTLVALGTSLPELVVGITAIRKGHPELLVGNVIGADILNVLFVVGASAIAAPLPIVEAGNPVFLYLHLPTMILILVLFRLFIFRATRKGHFSRWMGVPLLLIYLAFVVIGWLI